MHRALFSASASVSASGSYVRPRTILPTWPRDPTRWVTAALVGTGTCLHSAGWAKVVLDPFLLESH